MTDTVAEPVVHSKKRVAAIDILRGLVMLLMLVDHVRERFFYHQNVGDPMDVDVTSPALFFTRISAHFCAPVFVFLTGLSAWLYAHPADKPPRSATPFLFKRGLFIIFIEVAVINWLWMGNYDTLYLQVMWAIGVSMLALSVLSALPHLGILLLGLIIVAGHNLLDPVTFATGETGYTLWAILHDRGYIWDTDSFSIKASYPVLPWIGVILLGYAMGPVYARTTAPTRRRIILVTLALSMWGLLIVLRTTNLYGETLPFVVHDSVLKTLISFVNYTKYPPSLDFILLTLGGAFLVLAALEHTNNRFSQKIELFGSAPMFFYIVHLTLLLVGYRLVLAIAGPNYGDLYAFDDVWQVWLCAALLALALFVPTRAFARFKHQSRHPLVKYL